MNRFMMAKAVLSVLISLSVSTMAWANNWYYDSTNNRVYTSSGKVGINCTPTSTFTLDVNGSVRSQTGIFKLGNSGQGGGLYMCNMLLGSGTDESPFLWASSGNSLYFSSNGGTTPNMMIDVNGNVGIGNTTSLRPLSLYNNNAPYMAFYNSNTGTASNRGFLVGFSTDQMVDFINYENTDIRFFTNGLPKLVITAGGSVGIGLITPDLNYKLDVNGSVKAREIRVVSADINDLTTTGTIAANEIKLNNAQWSDFVFEEGYKLPSLDKVETFVKENKHLPDIPSAEQISKDGLSMADMMARQMQKIEELTLYVIELKKENGKLQERVSSLENTEK